MPSASARTSAVVRPPRPSSGRTSCKHTASGASAASWRAASASRASSGGWVPHRFRVTMRSVDTRSRYPARRPAHSSLAAIDTARGGVLGDDDLAQPGQPQDELLPAPAREQLARRVGQALDLVEHLVVELADQRRDQLVDLGEVHDPSALGVELALDPKVDPVAVAVHARALVAGGHPGKEVLRLEPVAALQPR